MKRQKHLIKKKCQVCNKEFEIYPCFVKKRISCSIDCGKKARFGKKQSEETITKRVNSRKGYKHSEKTKELIGLANSGDRNWKWKGDSVSYTGLHNWIRSNMPKPIYCEECHKITTRLDAANLSQEYKREFNDWKYLCRSCHMKYDFKLGVKIQTGWKKREGNLFGQFLGIDSKEKIL